MNFAAVQTDARPRRAAAKSTAGFTLVEMLVAVSIFSIVMLIAVSTLLILIDANQRAQSIKSVMNNLNFAVESMSRTIRTGTDYDCGQSGSPLNCSNGSTQFSFTSAQGEGIVYHLNGNGDQLIRTITSGPNAGQRMPLTSEEVNIDMLTFYVEGAGRLGTTGDANQPRVVIVMRGTAGDGPPQESRFNIHTSVSQRIPDF